MSLLSHWVVSMCAWNLVLFLFLSAQFVLRFEPIPVELIGMSLMLCIFDPIVLDLGCLCSYGGVVFLCAVFLYSRTSECMIHESSSATPLGSMVNSQLHIPVQQLVVVEQETVVSLHAHRQISI